MCLQYTNSLLICVLLSAEFPEKVFAFNRFRPNACSSFMELRSDKTNLKNSSQWLHRGSHKVIFVCYLKTVVLWVCFFLVNKLPLNPWDMATNKCNTLNVSRYRIIGNLASKHIVYPWQVGQDGISLNEERPYTFTSPISCYTENTSSLSVNVIIIALANANLLQISLNINL